jgi:hypothetical protein
LKWQDFVLMEAFDTWLHPEVSYEQFRTRVFIHNPSLLSEVGRATFFNNGQETVYTTYNGNRIHFVIWHVVEQGGERPNREFFGSRILNIDYGDGDLADTLAGAGNYTDQAQFLNGTVLKSAGDAVVEIHNASLGTTITLDWSDPSHLVRTSDTGEVEEAGRNHEVWVDFDWPGPFEGDVFHPFNTIAAAADVVADGGVIKIMPGTTNESQLLIHANKRIRLVAPIGASI